MSFSIISHESIGIVYEWSNKRLRKYGGSLQASAFQYSKPNCLKTSSYLLNPFLPRPSFPGLVRYSIPYSISVSPFPISPIKDDIFPPPLQPFSCNLFLPQHLPSAQRRGSGRVTQPYIQSRKPSQVAPVPVTPTPTQIYLVAHAVGTDIFT